jgi:hypothetical protein
MTRRWPRRLAIALVGLAVLLTSLAILLWLARVELLSWTAARLLERQGLGPASFAVDGADFQGLGAHDVSLAGGALKARSLTFAFSPRELLAGHLVKIEIGGLDATLAFGKDGLELAGRPLLAGGGGTSPLASLSIDALGLKDAHLLLLAPGGRYEATLSATIALAAGSLKASGIAATVTAPVAGLSGPARIELAGSGALTEGRIAANGLAATITAPIAGLSAPVKAVVTADLAGAEGALEARNLSATVTAPVTGLQKSAALTVKSLKLQPEAGGALHIVIAQAAATPKDLPWALQGLDGDFLWQARRPRGSSPSRDWRICRSRPS